MTVRAVLFDVGGTLISEDPRDSLLPFLERQGAAHNAARWPIATRAAHAFHSAHQDGAKTWSQALEVWRGFDQIFLQELEVEQAPELLELLLDSWDDARLWPLLPGALFTLERLKVRGLRLGVVSNWDGGLATVLEVAGLTRFFEFVLPSALAGARKPDPLMFKLALEQLALPAAEVVYVGNNLLLDAHPARALGIWPVLIPSFGHALPPNADLAGVTLLSNLAELPGLFEH